MLHWIFSEEVQEREASSAKELKQININGKIKMELFKVCMLLPYIKYL
jgi:hypothetical protein